MKREDFRIVKIERFDGRDTKVSFRVERKGWFFWRYENETFSHGFAENFIYSLIKDHEAKKSRKVTKTIVG